MKKLTLLLLFIHLTIGGFCQTVTILDLKKLSNGEDADKILVPKSFQLVKTKRHQSRNQTLYVINNNTPKAESVQIGQGMVTSNDKSVVHDVTYMARDTNFANSILKQVNMSGMKLIDKKAQKSQTTYSFDSKKLFVRVIIKKLNNLPNIVEIHNKR